jgi:probable F420-dependent oxidoreductase
MASRGRSAEDWREKARRAEGLGYSTLLMPDHITAQFAPIPALTAAAAATTTLRVGSFVFANDYRNPVVLAREAAILDLLSSGRLEFGIGAGWSRHDYRQLGIAYERPKTRVDRMLEAVRLIKRLWTEAQVTHEGPHYRVTDAMVLPRPVQRPHPPVMIGGGGPRMLRIAAREAQILALLPVVDARGRHRLRTITQGSVAERVRQIRGMKRFADLELNVIVIDVQITDARQSLLRATAARLKSGLMAIVKTPFLMYGSKASLTEDLLARRERLGISYIAIPYTAIEAFAPVVAKLRGK